MSKLEKLIAELCPDGVEYRTLGEIATDMYRGSGITRSQLTESGTPCVRYGEIYTTYNVWFDTCVSYTDEASIPNKKWFEHGDILFAITGESVDEIAKSCAYVGHDKCLAGGDIVVMKHNQDPKYLAYALSTTDAQIQKSKGKVKSKVVHSSIPALREIVIPVPPLPVQQEIVRILDKFTALESELEAELETRKRQYEYYRNLLLTFDNPVKWMTISDVCKNVSSGGTPNTSRTDFYNGDIPWLRTQEINWNEIHDTSIKITENGLANSSAQWIPPNCVIVAMYGATAAKVAINKIPLTTNQACCNLEVNPSIAHYRYVFHWLSKEYHTLKSLGRGSQSNINSTIIKEYPIPVPPLAEQERIVAILDRFDGLVNDVLPAEIAARRKQYEYYRDKLLTFKEAAS